MQQRWFYRRKGEVGGPVSAERVAELLVLGRLDLDDEVRTGDADWAPVARHADLIPEPLRLDAGPRREQALLLARMALDERTAERRSGAAAPGGQPRTGDRRRREPPQLRSFRELRARVLGAGSGRRDWLGWLAVLGVAIALAAVAAVLLTGLSPEV